MSATDDLRGEIIEALARQLTANSPAPFAYDTGCERYRAEYLANMTPFADAIMPTVREALAEAYDKGYAVATDEFVHSDYCGRTCQCNGLAGTANPWKAGS